MHRPRWPGRGRAAAAGRWAVVGTPAFMAPEQAGDPLAADGRADIYALGGTFYNLVTGRPPFPGETAVELIRKHAEEPLVPPGEFVPGCHARSRRSSGP